MSIKTQIKQKFSNKYIKNTIWLILDKIFSIPIRFVVLILIAKHMGTGDFGLFNYIISIVAFMLSLSALGMETILIKKLVSNKQNTDKLLGTGFILRFFSSFILWFSLSAFLFLFSSNHTQSIYISIVAFSLVFTSFSVIDYFFQSQVKSKYIVFANLFSKFITAVINIILLYFGSPIIYFLIVLLIDSILLAISFIYMYMKQGKSIFLWKFDKKLAKIIISESWPLIVSGLVIAIYSRVDQIMIKHMIGNEGNGIYSSAIRLIMLYYMFPGLLTNSFFPALVNSYNHNRGEYKIRLQKLFDFFMVVSIVSIIIIYFFGETIILTLYGKQYYGAHKILNIFFIGAIISTPGMLGGKIFIIENQQKFAMLFRIGGALVNIVLNYYFIKKWGIEGAAWATICGVIFVYLLFSFFNCTGRFVLLLRYKSILLPFRFLKYGKKLYNKW
jgi:O-antigen/teichoic acid export membrane protein